MVVQDALQSCHVGRGQLEVELLGGGAGAVGHCMDWHTAVRRPHAAPPLLDAGPTCTLQVSRHHLVVLAAISGHASPQQWQGVAPHQAGLRQHSQSLVHDAPQHDVPQHYEGQGCVGGCHCGRCMRETTIDNAATGLNSTRLCKGQQAAALLSESVMAVDGAFLY